MEIPETKTCRRCGKTKSLTSFDATEGSRAKPRKTARRVVNDPRRQPDGRKSVCRACYKTAKRRRRGAITLPERSAIAAAKRATAHAATARSRALRELKRLLAALAEQRCNESGQTYGAVRYYVRYHTQPAFREREIARRWARKADERRLVADGSLTQEDIRQLFAAARTCPYCERSMASKDKTLDHVIPVSRGGTHTRENVVVCCRSCNVHKHARTPDEWRADALASRCA